MGSTKIKVNWSMTSPPLQNSTWCDLLPKTEKNHAALENSLNLPANTLGYLANAFEQGANRKTGFKGEDAPAVRAAANIFKRGVGADGVSAIESNGTYDIDFLPSVPSLLKQLPGDWNIVDRNVHENWSAFRPDPSLVLELTEASKTLVTVAKILEAWNAAGKPIHWNIVGGGILGDTAAFAAALAGVKFTLIPTTLLAAVDACVGGKTGVNFPPYGKNQVGLFAFPESVLICEKWFKTLPRRQLIAGAAECLKHGILTKSEAMIVDIINAFNNGGPWKEILPDLVRVKAQVVEEDPNEAGKRGILNLGHTLAHALEAFAHHHAAGSPNCLIHGEAVGMGIAYACLLSERLTGYPKQSRDFVINALVQTSLMPSTIGLAKKLGINSADLGSSFSEILAHMKQDKKADGEKLKFILLNHEGDVANAQTRYLSVVDPAEARHVWNFLIGMLN